MTFRRLLEACGFSERAYHGLFLLSKAIKNLDQYLEKRDQPIDFSGEIFLQWYHSDLPPERFAGRAFFRGLELHLSENVFCPRHESELMVEELSRFGNLGGNYVDLCAGSGAIGIAVLKENPTLKGALVELDPSAVENIEVNLRLHNIGANVIQGDWLQHLEENPNYQIITANFPYLDEEDGNENLTDPPLALYAPEGGWYHYRRLLEWLSKNKHWRMVVLESNGKHEDKWRSLKNMETRIVKGEHGSPLIVVLTRPQAQS